MSESYFPLRVAAIDVGTNAIRFVASEFMDPTHWVDLEYLRVPVRLGKGTFLTGRLEEEAMAATVEAMGAFRRYIDTYGIPRYRAVATSAVRESRNGGDLVDRIRAETGIQLETITGSEEARLIWAAVRSRVPMGEGRWMLTDLGGGSLEISVASVEGTHWIESHTMGTVRLLEDLGGEARNQHDFRELAREYAGTLRIPDRITDDDSLAGLMATGGNIETLAELGRCTPDDTGVSRLPLKTLQDWIDRLADMSVEARVEELGLRQDRADVILPAAILYERVALLAGVQEIVVPHVGVKEGVLVDLVEDITGPGVHATRLEREALHGALALGRRFRFDEAHARHVARLSLSLFDQLRELHGLGDPERRILLGAAVLHDVGQFLSYRKHHKHSLYLIYNSELPNYARAEIPLVALVARYHRRAEPKNDHYLFEELAREDRTRVRRLASILRVADALDREHLQRVTEVGVVVKPAEIVLEVEGRGDLLLEQWALEKKARMFRSVFGVPVRLTVPEPTLGPSVI
ncbi:MAG: Ppx/GppA phosphatase family protein [Gemmatimonadota bacterium]